MAPRTNARNYGEALCKVCKKTFIKYHHNNVYCSDECRNKFNHSKPEQKIKRATRHKTWATTNKDRRRNYHYTRVFGITLEQYNDLLSKQNGVCSICQKPPKEGAKSLAVDHDHKTGEIFGLLCWLCNRVLVGKIRDPKLFTRAAEYLKRGTGWIVPPKKRRRKKRK